MTQETFAFTHTRRRDPDTSKKAAESVAHSTDSICADILRVMRGENTPMAVEEVLDFLPHLTREQVWKRMSDLKLDGQLIESGEMHVNRSGRRAMRLRVRGGE